MPTNITDVDTWTTPIAGPADADAQAAASYLPGYQGLANRTLHLANRVGGPAGADEWVYETPRTRTIVISMGGAMPRSADWAFQSSLAFSESAWIQAEVSGELYIPLNAYLRNGMIITDARVLLKPGVARTGANKMQVALRYQPIEWLSPGDLDPVELGNETHADSVTSWTVVSLASDLGAGHTVVKRTDVVSPAELHTRDYYLRIRAGTTEAPATLDEVQGAYLVVTEPGPRSV